MAKRTFDLLVGLALAVLTTPLVVLAALALTMTYRCSPFFTQTRIGRHGRPFRFVKLRTLPATAPAYADKYEIASLRLPWAADLLRRTHLDELPQLWLVVTGHMSLVGPRPEMPNLHARMDPTFAALRTSVRPGVTGPWQISEQAHRLILEAPEFDLAYLQRSSLLLDLSLLARTVLVALGLATPLTSADFVVGALEPVPAGRTVAVNDGALAA